MAFDYGGASIAFNTAYNTTTNIGTNLISGYMARKQSQLLASSLRSQILLNTYAAERENAYLNEANAQQDWNLNASARQFQGKQVVAHAASGFNDMSSGDYALVNETARQADRAAYGIRRSTYLQAFENTRQARMEAVRLEYAARAAEEQGKLENKLSKINAFTSALGSLADGASQYISYKGFSGNDIAPTFNPANQNWGKDLALKQSSSLYGFNNNKLSTPGSVVIPTANLKF